MDRSPHESRFLEIDGIRLHYLDWGGQGEFLLFLAGYGCNAHVFDSLAPRFTGRFHVLGLTRRGHGQSQHPETGYDIDTLTGDIYKFLNSLSIDRVTLAGHSMAGVELSHFNALHPQMVSRLVFLDAAYDRSSGDYLQMVEKNPIPGFTAPGSCDDYFTPDDYFAAERRASPALEAIWTEAMDSQGRHEVMKMPDGRIVDRMSPAIAAALNEMMKTYVPEDLLIRAPTLAIYTIDNGRYYISDEWMTEEQKQQVRRFFREVNSPWIRGNIEQFKRNVPHAQVAVLPEGHHYCFLKEEEQVFCLMEKFFTAHPNFLS